VPTAVPVESNTPEIPDKDDTVAHAIMRRAVMPLQLPKNKFREKRYCPNVTGQIPKEEPIDPTHGTTGYDFLLTTDTGCW